MTKLFSLNLVLNDLKDVATSSAVYYFHREFLLILNGNQVYKVSTRTTQVDSINLKDRI